MEINITLDNLQSVIEESVKKVVDGNLEDIIRNIIENQIQNQFREKIEEAVTTTIEQSISNYIENSRIYVGTQFGEEPISMSPHQYINSKIKEIFEKECFTKVDKNYYGNVKKEVPFKEYIDKQYDIDGTVEKHMSNFAKQFKRQLEQHLKDNYNKNLQNVLCATVIDLLMQDDQFKSICKGIEQLS